MNEEQPLQDSVSPVSEQTQCFDAKGAIQRTSIIGSLTESDVKRAVKDSQNGMVAYQINGGWTLTLGSPPVDYIGPYYFKNENGDACLEFAQGRR